jgi:hypothetical protein
MADASCSTIGFAIIAGLCWLAGTLLAALTSAPIGLPAAVAAWVAAAIFTATATVLALND